MEKNKKNAPKRIKDVKDLLQQLSEEDISEVAGGRMIQSAVPVLRPREDVGG